MLVNGCVAWNMSAKMKGVFRSAIDNSTWRMYATKNLLNWKGPIDKFESSIFSPVVIDNHSPKPISKSAIARIRCVLCGLETSIQKIFEFKLLTFVTEHLIICQFVTIATVELFGIHTFLL